MQMDRAVGRRASSVERRPTEENRIAEQSRSGLGGAVTDYTQIGCSCFNCQPESRLCAPTHLARSWAEAIKHLWHESESEEEEEADADAIADANANVDADADADAESEP